jgi:hypothetical protein
MRFNDVATTAGDLDDEQSDLADLIEEGDDETEVEAGDGEDDAGTDDLAALIADGPEDDGIADRQQGGEVDDGARHDNDDGVEAEMVAAE